MQQALRLNFGLTDKTACRSHTAAKSATGDAVDCNDSGLRRAKPASRFARLSLTTLAVLLLSPAVQARVDSVFVQSQLDYNAILISSVDVIFLYDPTLIEQMPQSKSSWFSSKSRFIEAAGDGADLVHVFIPQGFDSEMLSLPERRDQAVAVFVYAEHDAAQRGPVDITQMDNALVQINQFGIVVSTRD